MINTNSLNSKKKKTFIYREEKYNVRRGINPLIMNMSDVISWGFRQNFFFITRLIMRNFFSIELQKLRRF